MDKQNIIVLVFAFIVVLINGLIGHFFAPYGMDLTPVVLTITTSLIAFKTKNLKLIWQSILIYCFVALNDISIKLYSGGSHDMEGLGWIHLFLFIGLLPTLGILVMIVIKNKQDQIKDKVFAVVTFLVLISVHLYLFGKLGLGQYYSMN